MRASEILWALFAAAGEAESLVERRAALLFAFTIARRGRLRPKPKRTERPKSAPLDDDARPVIIVRLPVLDARARAINASLCARPLGARRDFIIATAAARAVAANWIASTDGGDFLGRRQPISRSAAGAARRCARQPPPPLRPNAKPFLSADVRFIRLVVAVGGVRLARNDSPNANWTRNDFRFARATPEIARRALKNVARASSLARRQRLQNDNKLANSIRR